MNIKQPKKKKKEKKIKEKSLPKLMRRIKLRSMTP